MPVKEVKIGVRKAPAPEGRPDFIRIDSVHQVDPAGVKSVLHINAVDCVTQWDLVATVQGLNLIRDPAQPLPYWMTNS